MSVLSFARIVLAYHSPSCYSCLAPSVGEAHVLWGLTLPEGSEGTPCGEGDSCLDFGVARVVVTVEDHCQKVAWTSNGDGDGNSSLAELRDCVLLEGHW